MDQPRLGGVWVTLLDIIAAVYALIAVVVAVVVYRKSVPEFHSAVMAVVVGAIWPMMLVVLLTGEDRGI